MPGVCGGLVTKDGVFLFIIILKLSNYILESLIMLMALGKGNKFVKRSFRHEVIVLLNLIFLGKHSSY